MKIEIDKYSGFCFGVVNAIKIAEEYLVKEKKVFSLGDIVHNEAEIKRLADKGMQTITKKEYLKLKNCTVLIRAHGEPPDTYEYANKNNIRLIEATCPVVLKLQERIKSSYEKIKDQNGQLVIFGTKGHAEVIGLCGQTDNNAIIISGKDDLDKIDFSKPIIFYSQTTKSIDEFSVLAKEIKDKAENNVSVQIKDTICRQVSNRAPQLKKFVKKHDLILFISSKKSSNGKYLFQICKNENPNSQFISGFSDIKKKWFNNIDSVGICGATSTPQWLMEKVKEWIESEVQSTGF